MFIVYQGFLIVLLPSDATTNKDLLWFYIAIYRNQAVKSRVNCITINCAQYSPTRLDQKPTVISVAQVAPRAVVSVTIAHSALLLDATQSRGSPLLLLQINLAGDHDPLCLWGTGTMH